MDGDSTDIDCPMTVVVLFGSALGDAVGEVDAAVFGVGMVFDVSVVAVSDLVGLVVVVVDSRAYEKLGPPKKLPLNCAKLINESGSVVI